MTFENELKPGANNRRLWIGCISLLIGAALTAMAVSNALAKSWCVAKEVRSLVVWYVQGDQWRAYQAYAKFLFRPSSGVENR